MLKWFKTAKEKNNRKIKERRNSSRVNSNLNVVYSLADKTNARIISQAKDISATGLKLLPYRKLKNATFVDIKIDLPKDYGIVSALGKVMWYKRRGGIGIKFLIIRPEDEEKYLAYSQTTQTVKDR